MESIWGNQKEFVVLGIENFCFWYFSNKIGLYFSGSQGIRDHDWRFMLAGQILGPINVVFIDSNPPRIWKNPLCDRKYPGEWRTEWVTRKIFGKRKTLKTIFKLPCFNPVAKAGPFWVNPMMHAGHRHGSRPWGMPTTPQVTGYMTSSLRGSSISEGKFHLDL